ncbi:hypothetical protein AB1046_00185 [Promicromonospora sp. Populi]|uniref:hypothetical protein n=1 Tax=Promicromonospora sp. Populi TaxID=3239420 RepID=UPI0034E2F600
MMIVGVVLLAGCAVDVEAIPGTYSEADGDAEIRLDEDRTFVATAVPGSAVDADLSDEALDFSGRWEWVDSSTSREHVYLMVDDGGPSDLRGVQLYVEGADTVAFIESPGSPPSLVLER